MKFRSILIILCLVLSACDMHDSTRQRIAAEIQNSCLADGADRTFCRCVKADILQNENFTNQIAKDLTYGYQHPLVEQMIFGARLRCMCRVYPEQTNRKIRNANMKAQLIFGTRMANPMIDCSIVKPIKY